MPRTRRGPKMAILKTLANGQPKPTQNKDEMPKSPENASKNEIPEEIEMKNDKNEEKIDKKDDNITMYVVKDEKADDFEGFYDEEAENGTVTQI